MRLPGPTGPQVELRDQPVAPLRVRRDPGQAGANYETAISGGLRIADEAARTMAIDNEHRAVITSTKAIAQARNDLTQKFLEAQRQAPPGAAGFAGQFQTTVHDYADALLKQPGNDDPMVQRFLSQRMAGLASELNEHALAFETNADLAKRQSDINDTMNLQANTVRTDPTQFPGALGEALAAVRGGGLPADKVPAAEAQVRDTLTTAYIQGLTAKNPAFAQKELDSGKYDGDFALGRKDQLLRQNQQQLDNIAGEQERAAREAQAQQRAWVETRFDDELTARATTGRSLGEINPAVIQAAYPADKYGDVAARKIQQLDLASQGYAARQSIAFTSQADDQAKIAASGPQSASGFAMQLNNQAALAQAVNNKWARLTPGSSKFDPAGYVTDNSPQLAQLWQEAQKDPSRVRDAVALSGQLQSQLNLPPEQQRLLSNDQAKTMSAWIQNLPPDQAAATLNQMAQAYGDRFKQFLTETNLPPSYQLLATVNGPAQSALLDALKPGPKVLNDLAGPNAELVKKALPDQMGDFLKTVTAAPNGANVGDAWQNGVQSLALRYAGQGTDPNTAVKQAFDNLIGNRYDFLVAPGYNVRVPKGALPQVQSYADNMLANLKSSDLAPPRAGDVTGQLTPEQQQQFYLKNGVQNGAQWVTSPSDDGLILLDSGTNGRRYVVTRTDGTPVAFKFSDAMQLPATAAAAMAAQPASEAAQTGAAGAMVQ